MVQLSNKRISASVVIVLCLLISWVGVIDKTTTGYLGEAIEESLIAYASARALNSAISVAQSAEIGFSFWGEANIHPLESLDPANDMVEDYATVMKYAIGSLIVQKLLINILSTATIKWILTIVGLASIAAIFLIDGKYASYLFKGFLFVILIRFMLVASVLMSNIADNSLMNEEEKQKDIINQTVKFLDVDANKLPPEEQATLKQQISELKNEQDRLKQIKKNKEDEILSARSIFENDKLALAHINEEKGLEKYNIFTTDEKTEKAEKKLEGSESVLNSLTEEKESISQKLGSLKEKQSKLEANLNGGQGFISEMKRKAISLKESFEAKNIKEILDSSINAMLNLIALFVLKTLIMPLAFLWVFWRSFKLVWNLDLRDFVTTKEIQKT